MWKKLVTRVAFHLTWKGKIFSFEKILLQDIGKLLLIVWKTLHWETSAIVRKSGRWPIFHGNGNVFLQRWNGDGFENISPLPLMVFGGINHWQQWIFQFFFFSNFGDKLRAIKNEDRNASNGFISQKISHSFNITGIVHNLFCIILYNLV